MEFGTLNLSPDGAYLAFHRLFPRSTDHNIVEDTLAVLTVADLDPSTSLARLPNQPTQLKESVGESVYPPSPSPGSVFFPALLWNKASTAFYFLQELPGNIDYVAGRCELQTKRWTVKVSPPQPFRGMSDPPETIGHLTAFHLNPPGALDVSFEKTIPPHREFTGIARFDSLLLTALP